MILIMGLFETHYKTAAFERYHDLAKQIHDSSCGWHAVGAMNGKRALPLSHSCYDKNSEHPRFECGHPDCPEEKFHLKQDYQAHLVRTHEDMRGVSLYPDDDCDFDTHSAFRLASHSLSHSDARPEMCSLYGKSFKNVQGLRHYENDVHRLRGPSHRDTTWQCPTCSKGHVGAERLIAHMVEHFVNKDIFRCDICQEEFKEERLFRLHRLLHVDRPKYICDLTSTCHGMFWSQTTVKKHQEKHRCCPFCNKIGLVFVNERIGTSKFIGVDLSDAEQMFRQACRPLYLW